MAVFVYICFGFEKTQTKANEKRRSVMLILYLKT